MSRAQRQGLSGGGVQPIFLQRQGSRVQAPLSPPRGVSLDLFAAHAHWAESPSVTRTPVVGANPGEYLKRGF